MIPSLKMIDVSMLINSHSMKLRIKLLFCIGGDLQTKNLSKKLALAFNIKSGAILWFIDNGEIKYTSLSL